MREIMAVLGLISPEDLGVTLIHEHLLCSVLSWFSEPREASWKPFVNEPVNITNQWRLHIRPMSNKDNLLLADVPLAIEEAMRFKKLGGNTIVELSNSGCGQDPLGLREIAVETGLNIVMGCGYYTDLSHPPDMGRKTTDEIEEEILRDVTEGVDNTGIKAGIIGEIGTSDPITTNEQKVLRAAARVQQETQLALSVHLYPFSKLGMKVLDILEKEGALLHKVILGHLDHTIDSSLRYHKSLARRGSYIAYDGFGKERQYHMERFGVVTPSDDQRLTAVKKLIEAGFLHQILVSTDVCWKIHLARYGGYGYDHILRNILHRARMKGFSEREIEVITKENPKQVLTS